MQKSDSTVASLKRCCWLIPASGLPVNCVSSLILFLRSTIALWYKPIEHLTETALGKIMLVYTTPTNFVIYNLTALSVIYGLWTHQGLYVVGGYSLLLLPHLRTWKR